MHRESVNKQPINIMIYQYAIVDATSEISASEGVPLVGVGFIIALARSRNL